MLRRAPARGGAIVLPVTERRPSDHEQRDAGDVLGQLLASGVEGVAPEAEDGGEDGHGDDLEDKVHVAAPLARGTRVLAEDVRGVLSVPRRRQPAVAETAAGQRQIPVADINLLACPVLVLHYALAKVETADSASVHLAAEVCAVVFPDECDGSGRSAEGDIRGRIHGVTTGSWEMTVF